MPVKIIDGDLFCTKAPYICHQVNCKGKMGSGVAKQVRALYPGAYLAYKTMCANMGEHALGRAQIIVNKNTFSGSVVDEKKIVNVFAQKNYGYDGKCYTDYDAFQSAMEELERELQPGDTVAMPYLIGCGLGGGDRNRILNIIESTIAKEHVVELWRLGGRKNAR